MFRRHWSGLPADPMFADDLKGLGYFVNDEDEVRNIADPDLYFKFFIDRNSRINDRQRFHFDHAVEAIVHERLQQQGLSKIPLPLNTPLDQPHIPIFISEDLKTKTRIVVVLGEPTNELGLLARRVAGGPGGLNAGSMTSVVQALSGHKSTPGNAQAPGIVIANAGQTYWWPEKKRALTISASEAIQLPSMAHKGRRYVPSLNDIPKNENAANHVQCVFDEVLTHIGSQDAKIDIIAIGSSCETILRFLSKEENWAVWHARLNAMLMMGSVYPTENMSNKCFAEFLEKRACGYLLSSEPLGTALSPPSGNQNESIPPLGFPCFSSSEPHYTELILMRALKPALEYLERMALHPDFENEPIVLAERPEVELTEQDWEAVPEQDKPSISTVNPEWLKEQIKQKRRWDKFAKTGMAPDTDSEEDEED